MILDFEALARRVAAEAVAQVRPMVRDELARILDERADHLLDDNAAAAHLGLSVVAWRARVRRSSDLASLAVSIGPRGRRWRRSDLDQHVAASRPRVGAVTP